jgi:hypothetical protein
MDGHQYRVAEQGSNGAPILTPPPVSYLGGGTRCGASNPPRIGSSGMAIREVRARASGRMSTTTPTSYHAAKNRNRPRHDASRHGDMETRATGVRVRGTQVGATAATCNAFRSGDFSLKRTSRTGEYSRTDNKIEKRSVSSRAVRKRDRGPALCPTMPPGQRADVRAALEPPLRRHERPNIECSRRPARGDAPNAWPRRTS